MFIETRALFSLLSPFMGGQRTSRSQWSWHLFRCVPGYKHCAATRLNVERSFGTDSSGDGPIEKGNEPMNKVEKEILTLEQELTQTEMRLDVEALDRIYADDI